MYGSPDTDVHRSVVAEKYSNSLLAIWHSMLLLTSKTNLGIATLVKCLRVGSWYLGLNFCSIVRNPGLSTVDSGSISRAKQQATDVVSSLCSLESEESSLCLFHISVRDSWFFPVSFWALHHLLLLVRCSRVGMF